MTCFRDKYNFSDFTLKNYRRLLRIAKKKYKFRFFEKKNIAEPHLLLRHDLDHSIDAAHKMALIEKEEGVVATYQILLHSEMYSIFEKKTLELLKSIISYGHRLALHFDPTFYEISSRESLLEKIYFEKGILETLLNVKIKDISFHSPDALGFINWQEDSFHSMLNSYSEYFSERYEYVSDSNGYWRHKRLEDVLLNSSRNLQVLVHPIWWHDEVLAPRDRIQYWIDYRSKFMADSYDKFTSDSQRLNIGKEDG